jgi:hypothetical protein
MAIHGKQTVNAPEQPMFISSRNGDFRFNPGSPASEIGIVTIEPAKVGLRSTNL